MMGNIGSIRAVTHLVTHISSDRELSQPSTEVATNQVDKPLKQTRNPKIALAPLATPHRSCQR